MNAMRTKEVFGILVLFLCIMNLTSCDDDIPQDKIDIIKMFVSAETGTYQPWGASEPVEGMLIKEENESEYKALGFQGIEGLECEKGYEYLIIFHAFKIQ